MTWLRAKIEILHAGIEHDCKLIKIERAVDVSFSFYWYSALVVQRTAASVCKLSRPLLASYMEERKKVITVISISFTR